MEACKERDMWTLPHLNTRLYLNYKGFDNIGGLEAYVGVKTLHLGNNNIAKIECLDRMHDLRCLFLEGNRITVIEGLHNNVELRQLSLEGNAIRCVGNLSHHTKLEQINLAHNTIESLEDISELLQLPCLSNVDVSFNSIQDTEGVVEFWSGLAGSLRLLRYHQNPGVRFVENYRKRLITALPLLGYLDERPVFPVERKGAVAWSTGGKDAMEEVKRQHWKERHQAVEVEPERKELLTRMRKLALERIEREERERAEQEQERRQAAGAVASSAVAEGDPDALAGYADKWRSKVTLYGTEGLRNKVAQEGEGGSGTAGPRFAPPARGAAAEEPGAAEPEPATAEVAAPAKLRLPPPGAETAAAVARAAAEHREELSRPARPPPELPPEGPEVARPGASSRRGYRPPVDASEFRSGGKCEGQEERQFSVLGGDENMDLGLATAPRSACAAGAQRGALGGAGAPRSAADAGQYVPLIFQRNQEQASLEEMRALEQNMANSRLFTKSNTLADLD